jgi:hypothetical protein
MAIELDPETIKYLERLIKRGGHEGEKARSVLEIAKYDEDQPRDENGRFAGGGSDKDQKAADELVASDAKMGDLSTREQLQDVLRGGHQSGMNPGDEGITPKEYAHYVSVAMRTGNDDLVEERYKNTDDIYAEAERHAKELIDDDEGSENW